MVKYRTTRIIVTYWEMDEGRELILSSEYLADTDFKDGVKAAKKELKTLGDSHGCWITTQELQDDISLLGRHVWETTSQAPMILMNIGGKIKTMQELK
jgi:hypothetical protein